MRPLRNYLLPLSLLAFSSPALADGPSVRTDDPITVVPDKDDGNKTKVTAFVLSHPNVAEADMVEVMRAVESGLKQNPKLDMKDLDVRLAEFSQEVPQDQIDAARTALKDGQKAITDQRISDAVAKLEDAVTGFGKLLPYIKKQELADAMASLAIAQFEGGDKKAGHDQFLELVSWRPEFVYDSTVLPPKYQGQFDAVNKELQKAQRGSMVVHTEPEGAEAFVDGKYVGVTPCVADKLPVGKHFVSIKKEGFRKAATIGIVAPKKEVRVSVSLDKSEKYLLVEQAVNKIQSTLGADQIDQDAENLRAVLFIDQAVLVRAVGDASGSTTVDAWLYDLRNRKKLSAVHQVVGKGTIAADLTPMAQSLYLNVAYDGAIVAPVDAAPVVQKETHTPVYKTWWFWTAAVVVVGGVAGGTAGGVIASRPAGCPEGSACIQVVE